MIRIGFFGRAEDPARPDRQGGGTLYHGSNVKKRTEVKRRILFKDLSVPQRKEVLEKAGLSKDLFRQPWKEFTKDQKKAIIFAMQRVL